MSAASLLVPPLHQPKCCADFFLVCYTGIPVKDSKEDESEYVSKRGRILEGQQPGPTLRSTASGPGEGSLHHHLEVEEEARGRGPFNSVHCHTSSDHAHQAVELFPQTSPLSARDSATQDKIGSAQQGEVVGPMQCPSVPHVSPVPVTLRAPCLVGCPQGHSYHVDILETFCHRWCSHPCSEEARKACRVPLSKQAALPKGPGSTEREPRGRNQG